MDEAGRGPLAGPVVAAAVVLGASIPTGLDNSKRLSPARRAKLETAIRSSCGWAVAVVEPDEIDRLNIFMADNGGDDARCREPDSALAAPVSEVLIDGNMTPRAAVLTGAGLRERSSVVTGSNRPSPPPRSSPRNGATG